jgi:hypothetical protein
MDTRGVSQDSVTITHPGRCWHPATRETAFQQFIGGRDRIPERHGSDRTDSVRVEYQKNVFRSLENDVVRKLVLRNNVGYFYRRTSALSPARYLGKAAQAGDLIQKITMHKYLIRAWFVVTISNVAMIFLFLRARNVRECSR